MRRRACVGGPTRGETWISQKTLKDAVDAGDVPGVAAAAATDKGVIFEGGPAGCSPTA